jgi:ABC-type multidrug transport system fused ATPase/permease subunit
MSFLVLLSDPSLVEKYSVLAALRRLAGATPRELLGILAGVFSLLLVASALLNVYGLRAIGRFAYSVGDRVREVLFMEYLRRDYLFHAANGAGRLMDNVLNQADRVTVTLLNGQLLITNTVLMLLLLASIAWVNPWVAAGGAVVIAGSYLLFYRVIWQRVARNGRRQVQASGERVAVVEQALRGIKYLLLTRAQPAFTQRFTDANRALSRTVSDTQFIGQFPRHLLEFAAGIALISCAAWFSATLPGGVWLAQLSFIGFAGFRLLPVFQQMYHAFVVVRACRPALEILAGELAEDPAIPVAAVMPAESLAPALRTGVQLEKVSFRY